MFWQIIWEKEKNLQTFDITIVACNELFKWIHFCESLKLSRFSHIRQNFNWKKTEIWNIERKSRILLFYYISFGSFILFIAIRLTLLLSDKINLNI